jgi:hypothetical protein
MADPTTPFHHHDLHDPAYHAGTPPLWHPEHDFDPRADHYNVRPRGAQEVRHLNQYQGYFTTPEGDFPVSVVANSIKEAARILTMPGVFGEEITEPTVIKFTKGKVAVSIPIHHLGFNTEISPKGAIESGAYATPVHAEVNNGTEVIFTANEPFGWKFKGWFKGDLPLSSEKVAYIDVYDPYSTLVTYTAKYEFEDVRRNGRYIELGSGMLFDILFDKYSLYEGRLAINSSTVPDWYFVMKELTAEKLTIMSDPSIIQPGNTENEQYEFQFDITTTPIGVQLICTNDRFDNPWGFHQAQVLNLKWVGEL